MPLTLPNLDDRTYAELLAEAKNKIQQSCPEWTDLSAGDPGVTLLELFAYLTEAMLYRLNRLPEKVYIQFLRLLGVTLQPPAAAMVTLQFSRKTNLDQKVEIPRGTRVTVKRTDPGSEAPVFETMRSVTLQPGQAQVDVLACYAELVIGEVPLPTGRGAGAALSLAVMARRPPIIATTGDEYDLLVGVEARPEELDNQSPVVQHEGKVYRVWREVDNFSNVGDDPYVYVADRVAGLIRFAPTVRAEQPDGTLVETPQSVANVPAADRGIRLWYRRGGGLGGNVPANTLTELKDRIAGVDVTNPAPASGGRSAEALENALIRGPLELHSLHRAVTAQDFELLARTGPQGVARAKAFTKAAVWKHAVPGTVEVLLVPCVSDSEGQVKAEDLEQQEQTELLPQVQEMLNLRRPLGTMCVVDWARYKTVHVTARVVIRRTEDKQAITDRLLARLYQTISPLPTRLSPAGWPFGQPLRASHVYDIALAEPGVLWADQVQLLVDDVPDREVNSVWADQFQPHTWYAGSREALFRSLNDGDGWEIIGRFAGEHIEVIRSHPNRPGYPHRAGYLAVASTLTDGGGSRLRLSTDCGETWMGTVFNMPFRIHDVAWLQRGNEPWVLLATNTGLYELPARPDGSVRKVSVIPGNDTLGFWTVATSWEVGGQIHVAVAAYGRGGVYLSPESNAAWDFRRINKGIEGEDIHVLAVRHVGSRSYLWAGVFAEVPTDEGKGCYRWELRGREDAPEGWRAYSKGWRGGSCRAIAFLGTQVLAASHRAGVQRLDANAQSPTWQMPDIDCGLRLRDPNPQSPWPFQPLETVAADPEDGATGADGVEERVVMVGGAAGTFRSKTETRPNNLERKYASVSEREFADRVTLPPTWLFCSGAHDLTVVSEDEAK